MATHSSILEWRIPWTEETGWATVCGVTKSRTWLKWLSTAHSYSLSYQTYNLNLKWYLYAHILEKEMATHSSTWKIPWAEEPGKLQSMRLQRVGHDWATSLSMHIHMYANNYVCVCVCAFHYLALTSSLASHSTDNSRHTGLLAVP